MIRAPDRRKTLELIDEAVAAGARRAMAGQELGLSERTYRRWQGGGGEPTEDRRAPAVRPIPANALSDAEHKRVLEVVCRPEFASLPPSQIVPDPGRPGRVPGQRIELLPHPARGGPAAPPRAGGTAEAEPTAPSSILRTQPDLGVGHYLVARTRRRHLPRPLPEARPVLAQGRRLGSLRRGALRLGRARAAPSQPERRTRTAAAGPAFRQRPPDERRQADGHAAQARDLRVVQPIFLS